MEIPITSGRITAEAISISVHARNQQDVPIASRDSAVIELQTTRGRAQLEKLGQLASGIASCAIAIAEAEGDVRRGYASKSRG